MGSFSKSSHAPPMATGARVWRIARKAKVATRVIARCWCILGVVPVCASLELGV